MKLSQLQYVVALDRYGSFSRAAKELYVSQPSVSVGIRELEEELGYSILVRNNRGLAFTPEGANVLEKAKLIISEMESIRTPERTGNENICGTVSIGATPHFCNSILLDFMLAVQGKYPGLTLYSSGDDSESIVRRVIGEELDIGVVQLCDLDEVDFFRRAERGEICFGELFREKMCVVAREGHPLTQKEQVSPAELLNYPYATFGRSTNRRMFSLYSEAGLTEKVVRIGEITALRRFLMEYDPITMIPRSAIKSGNDISYGCLCEINVPLIDWSSPVMWLHGCAAPGTHTVRVIEMLRERCGSAAPE